MKKTNTKTPSPKRAVARTTTETIGMDTGDKNSRLCCVGGASTKLWEDSVATTRKGIHAKFDALPRCRVALEVGTHSPWISRLLTELGFTVIVANPRQLRLISHSSRKNDRLDALLLARLAHADPALLRPIQHRSEDAQKDLLKIRVRAQLVEQRTALVNSVRGFSKAQGERVPACDAQSMDVEKLGALPAELREDLQPLLEHIEALTKSIHALDRKIEQIARTKYPETALLEQVHGVGTLIALTFVLTVEDRERFQKSRDVGCYVGLRPRQSESGERQPQLPISKEGDVYLRKLLVQGAHCILRPRAPDTDLKRWGLRLCERGGKSARKRAIVAVARKLAVLLHRLWTTGEAYEPLRNSEAAERQMARRKKAA